MAIPISELRIGSRVHSPDGKSFIVTAITPPINGVYCVVNKHKWVLSTKELKGIPLTRELLAKHGFTIPISRTIDDPSYQNARIIFNGLELIIGVQPPLEHLHHLQNIVTSLTGKDLNF